MNRHKYIDENSPFLLRLNDAAINLLILQARVDHQQPKPLQVALRLAEPGGVFAKHLDELKSNLSRLARFSTTADDLQLYKLGFIAPLIIIRVSYEEELRPGMRNLLPQILGIKWDYDDAFSSFIDRKVDLCTQMRKNNAKWDQVFGLAYDYHTSVYYCVGIDTAKIAFENYLHMIGG